MSTDDDWKTYDEFANGIDTYRLPQHDLTGQSLTVTSTGGPTVTYAFESPGTVSWTATGAGWDGASGTDPCDVVAVRDDVLFVNVAFGSRERETLTTFLDRGTGRALSVHCAIAAEATPGVPQVSQEFWPGTTDDVAEPTGEEPAPTRDLIGRRHLNRYSPDHLYEHTYINSGRYAWQCLQGVQRGHGDMDQATYWRFAEGLYLFAFREFRIPVASVWLFDVGIDLTTTGTFLGLNGEGQAEVSRAGGRIYPLGAIAYPDVTPA